MNIVKLLLLSKNVSPQGPGSNKPPDLILRDPLGKNVTRKKYKKIRSMICHIFVLVGDKVSIVFLYVYSFKGPGSNKPPELVLRDPFGKMLARKKYKKILSMICHSFYHLEEYLIMILSIYVFCFMLDLRDCAFIKARRTSDFTSFYTSGTFQ